MGDWDNILDALPSPEPVTQLVVGLLSGPRRSDEISGEGYARQRAPIAHHERFSATAADLKFTCSINAGGPWLVSHIGLFFDAIMQPGGLPVRTWGGEPLDMIPARLTRTMVVMPGDALCLPAGRIFHVANAATLGPFEATVEGRNA